MPSGAEEQEVEKLEKEIEEVMTHSLKKKEDQSIVNLEQRRAHVEVEIGEGGIYEDDESSGAEDDFNLA